MDKNVRKFYFKPNKNMSDLAKNKNVRKETKIVKRQIFLKNVRNLNHFLYLKRWFRWALYFSIITTWKFSDFLQVDQSSDIFIPVHFSMRALLWSDPDRPDFPDDRRMRLSRKEKNIELNDGIAQYGICSTTRETIQEFRIGAKMGCSKT